MAAALLLIAITVLIEMFKDNKIQDWLERCIWGKGKRYGTLDEEMSEFKKAVA